MSGVERDEIERRDFPVARRGYDQTAVDAHLRRVADAFEGARSPLAAGTSEQVRAILEAAEAGAAEMRADAGRRVARLEETAGGLRGRLDELETLLAAMRRGGEQVSEEIARLRAEVGFEPPPVEAPEPTPIEAPEPAPDGDEAGARLIALNMALSGTPRDETARYLTEHFEIENADALLDDVYARAAR
jgi:DivIVA domain-containing protein